MIFKMGDDPGQNDSVGLVHYHDDLRFLLMLRGFVVRISVATLLMTY
jgi:hypothetical protein